MKRKISKLKEQITELAKKEGIDIVRISQADPFEGYLLSNSVRRDPHLTLPEAHSLIIFGIYIGGFNLSDWDNPAIGRTSRLFLSGFFCDVLKPLKPILSLLHDDGFKAEICDTYQPGGSILPLKLAAVRAGIGWQGKNTLLISPEYGTFLALGGIITDALLEFNNEKVEDHCGKCHACQKACPTNALSEPYRLKRERCLSSLIEEELLTEEVRQLMGNKIIDCEICQDVCPYNKKHLRNPLITDRSTTFDERKESLKDFFKLPNLLKLSERGYKKYFDSYRAGIPHRVFRRNVVAALGNSNQPDAISLLKGALEDSDPEIREIAQNSMNSLRN
jgi:epoxyqueuosine reductase